MIEILNAILPVFIVIALGFVIEKKGILGPHAAEGLNKFVAKVSLPILLFYIMSNESISDVLNWKWILGLLAGLFSTYIIATLICKCIWRGQPAENAMRAFAVSFPNGSFMGIPIIFAYIGKPGLLPAALAGVFITAVLLVTVVVLEYHKNKHHDFSKSIMTIGARVLKNPIVLGAILGIISTACQIHVPVMLNKTFKLLGSAAAPCALFAIGQVLSRNKVDNFGEIFGLSLIKLLVCPLITFGMLYLIGVDKLWMTSGAISSSMPTGTAVYLIAYQYQTYQKQTSALIFFSTIISLVTVSLILTLI